MNRSFPTPTVDPDWAASRETHPAVATAIHAIASQHRSPQAIWEAPSPTEWGNVEMAVQEYLRLGDFEPETDGRYQWGQEAVTIEDPEATFGPEA